MCHTFADTFQHFLNRVPEVLVKTPEVLPLGFNESSIAERLRYLCDKCNDPSSPYAQRKVLSIVRRVLADSSMDETGVRWEWWDQDERDIFWSQTLTRSIFDVVSITEDLWSPLVQSNYTTGCHCVFASSLGPLLFLHGHRQVRISRRETGSLASKLGRMEE
jgi:hypothetical protein